MRKDLGRQLRPHRYTADDELRLIGKAGREALGGDIRCLVWNILKARRTHWARDFKSLIADRDLVLLQEAVLNAPSDRLFEADDKFEWVMARSFRHPTSGVEHGVKTGCSVSAGEKQFYLSPHAEPLSQTRKLLLVTRYALQSERATLMVLNMHAINFVTIDKYVEQLDQLDAVLGRHDGPVILGGDFNTWSPTRLAHFLEVARGAGLVEATMRRKLKLAHMNSHLDHVFYRGMTLKAIESLGEYTSSDHAPIVATFRLDEPDQV